MTTANDQSIINRITDYHAYEGSDLKDLDDREATLAAIPGFRDYFRYHLMVPGEPVYHVIMAEDDAAAIRLARIRHGTPKGTRIVRFTSSQVEIDLTAFDTPTEPDVDQACNEVHAALLHIRAFEDLLRSLAWLTDAAKDHVDFGETSYEHEALVSARRAIARATGNERN